VSIIVAPPCLLWERCHDLVKTASILLAIFLG
jgi:hypothetical protein